MGIARVGSNPAVVASAPLAEWSKALRSGRSHHSMAQVRILQGALLDLLQASAPFTQVLFPAFQNQNSASP